MTTISRTRRGPQTNESPGPAVYLRVLRSVAIWRTLWLRLRFGGWCVVSRGTRLRFGPGARIVVPAGSFLFIGFAHFNPTPAAIHLGRGARLVVEGTAQIHRGVRVAVHDGGCLEIGNRSYVNDGSTVTCFESIRIGAGCSISWNTNLLDTNAHQLLTDGVARPRNRPVRIEDGVWIGTGATVLPGVTLGAGAVVAAGSVVTRDVPAGSAVAGNPAKVLHPAVKWQQ